MMIVEADDPARDLVNSVAARSAAPAARRLRPAGARLLDHDNRIVDDESHGGRHAAERHHVKAMFNA